MLICLIFKEFGALQYRKFAYLVEELKDRCGILGVLKITNHNDVQVYNSDYRNFRSFTRTADYPHRPIIAYGERKSQQITRTGG